MKYKYIRVYFIGADYLTCGPYDTEVEMQYDINRFIDGSYNDENNPHINKHHIAYIIKL